MMEWIVTSSVLILIVILLRTVLKGKISLRLQYALWGLVLVRLLLPFSLFDSKFSVMSAVEQTAPAVVESAGDTVLGYRDYVTPDLSVVEPDPNASPEEQEKQYEENLADWKAKMEAAKAETGTPVLVRDVLKVVWLGVGALVALWFLGVNLRFERKLKRERSAVCVPHYPLRVYRSSVVETPCLFGLLRPAVYLTDEVTEETMNHVLAHELTHSRHGDHIWAALRCLCLAVHWYNPLVWLAASLSRRDAELACDEGTLKRIGEEQRTAYGRTLIDLTCCHRSKLALTATTMTGSKRGIRERVLLIAKKPRMKKWVLAVLLVLVIVAAGCTFSGAGDDADIQPSVQETPDPQPTESTSEADKEVFVEPEGVQSWDDWSEEDIARWQSETDGYGLVIQTNSTNYKEVGRFFAEALAARFVNASGDNPARCTDAVVLNSILDYESLTGNPKKLVLNIGIAYRPVNEQTFIHWNHGWVETLGEGWYSDGFYYTLEQTADGSWECTDVGTGGYGGWGYLNYDFEGVFDIYFQEFLNEEDVMEENMLATLFSVDWENFDARWGAEGRGGLKTLLDTVCLTEGRVYGPEGTRMWSDVYPQDQLYRNLYVMHGAWKAGTDFGDIFGEALKKQQACRPAIFGEALLQLPSEMRAFVENLMN